jgi:hypothetical protein
MPKPPISIVSSAEPAPTPPRPLSTYGSALWDSIQAEYRIEDRGGIELLAQACAALDRAEGLAAIIAQDGAVVHTRAGPKAHPALRDELANRAFCVKTLEKLGVSTEAIKSGPGRPPRPFGWTPPA